MNAITEVVASFKKLEVPPLHEQPYRPMYNRVHTKTITLDTPIQGLAIWVAVEHLVRARSCEVSHSVMFMKQAIECSHDKKHLFVVGQSSEHPWEDFLITPSNTFAQHFEPEVLYDVIDVVYNRHYWYCDKTESDDTERAMEELVRFSEQLADTLTKRKLEGGRLTKAT